MLALHGQAEERAARPAEGEPGTKRGRECARLNVCACGVVRVLCHQQLTPPRQTAGMRVHCMSLEYQ